ncbi:hypothetical protein DIPPA_12466 [Diplonema papillatum]|nr:hypothetical protein DIPPA_12466 [Diplonema papillatum]
MLHVIFLDALSDPKAAETWLLSEQPAPQTIQVVAMVPEKGLASPLGASPIRMNRKALSRALVARCIYSVPDVLCVAREALQTVKESRGVSQVHFEVITFVRAVPVRVTRTEETRHWTTELHEDIERSDPGNIPLCNVKTRAAANQGAPRLEVNELCSVCSVPLWSDEDRKAHALKRVQCEACALYFCSGKKLAAHQATSHPATRQRPPRRPYRNPHRLTPPLTNSGNVNSNANNAATAASANASHAPASFPLASMLVFPTPLPYNSAPFNAAYDSSGNSLDMHDDDASTPDMPILPFLPLSHQAGPPGWNHGVGLANAHSSISTDASHESNSDEGGAALPDDTYSSFQ